MEATPKRLRKTRFTEKYGALVDELELERNDWCKRFNTIFLLRRIIYSLILVGFYDNPHIQLYLCILCAIIPVIYTFSLIDAALPRYLQALRIFHYECLEHF